MEVIPVIDLMGGAVVRARHGNRASYRPIETPLSLTSDPLDVVAGLLSLYRFRTLYIADLDAIEGKGHAAEVIDGIARTFPGFQLWIDNGCADRTTAEGLLGRYAGASLVLGSESQRDTELVEALKGNERIILSLDFRGEQFLGPRELYERPSLWPSRLILMTLAKVGSGAGPDFAQYRAIRERGKRAVYLAGGLRDRADLDAVKASGAAGILVASALHDGRIGARDLAACEAGI